MAEPIRLELPLSSGATAGLRAGDAVLLSGPVFTARDATHERLLGEVHRDGRLPYGLEGQTLFYAGPTPPMAGRPAGSIGPTTAKRMDFATPELLRAGIVATIGKGERSQEVVDACRETGAVYFAAVGGAAALLATYVTDARPVAYDDLGTEALVRLTLREFPAFVAIDQRGGDLYRSASASWRQTMGESE